MLVFYYPVLAISIIYCIWLAYERADLRRRNRVLRERVTFMLCMAAKQLTRRPPLAQAGLGRGSPSARQRATEATTKGQKARWKEHARHGDGWQASTACPFSPPNV